jgi:hypothetical protein
MAGLKLKTHILIALGVMNVGFNPMSKQKQHKPYRDHEEAFIESLRKDPQFGAEYLNAVLEDGGQEELMLALRRVAQAFGGVPQIAKQTNLGSLIFAVKESISVLSHMKNRIKRQVVEGF